MKHLHISYFNIIHVTKGSYESDGHTQNREHTATMVDKNWTKNGGNRH